MVKADIGNLVAATNAAWIARSSPAMTVKITINSVGTISGAKRGEKNRLRIKPYRQPGAGHVLLGLADRVFAEMEDRGREYRGRMPVADALYQMVEGADPARGDHRHRHRIGDGAGERDVKTLPGAVAVHGREQDFAGAKRDHLAGIGDGVEAGRMAPAMGENLPARVLRGLRHLLGVDRDDDALVAEFFRRLLHKGTPGDRRGVDRNLVGAGSEQLADILHRAYATADGERHEAGLRGAPHHVENDAAVLMARGDVE